MAEFWLHAADGHLCGREQAKARALREVWMETNESTYGMLPLIAQRLRKNLSGKPAGAAPSAP